MLCTFKNLLIARTRSTLTSSQAIPSKTMKQYKILKRSARTPGNVGETISLSDAKLESALLSAGFIAEIEPSKPTETKVAAPAEKKTRKPRAKKAD